MLQRHVAEWLMIAISLEIAPHHAKRAVVEWCAVEAVRRRVQYHTTHLVDEAHEFVRVVDLCVVPNYDRPGSGELCVRVGVECM